MGESSLPLLQLVAVALVAAMLLMVALRHLSARQQQEQGVLWLQAMRMLITHIQRHRALSAGVLAGDLSLQRRLAEVQLQVSRDFEQIGGVGDWIKHSSSWQGITQHWARLAGNVYQLSVPRAIDQHNRLIKNILVLIDDIAHTHHLHSGAGFKFSVWRDLLTLAECVGQARAVGTALTAAGSRWGDSAFNQARRDLQRLDQEILMILDKPHCRSALDDSLLQSILDFLTYIDSQILAQGPLVPAAEFYQVATNALDQLYERFDQELNSINRRVTR